MATLSPLNPPLTSVRNCKNLLINIMESENFQKVIELTFKCQ